MRVGQRLDWGWAMSSLVRGTGLRADRLLNRSNRFASRWLQAWLEDVFPAPIAYGAAHGPFCSASLCHNAARGLTSWLKPTPTLNR